MSETTVLQSLPELPRLADGQMDYLQKVRELDLSQISFEELLNWALTGAAIVAHSYGHLECLSVQEEVRRLKQALISRHETEIARDSSI